MVAMELEGKNLGEKHRNYNKTVKSNIKDVDNKLDDFNVDEDDISNLIKIDLASETRNLEYILKVLVCDDILYVSRALKKCIWLFTEQGYDNIINANYLNTVLFKQMNTKAVNKFKRCLKSHLKDTSRVAAFYESENDPSEAVKWLPNCSTNFIIEKIKTHLEHLNISLLRRLSEKTITVLEIFIKEYKGYKYSTKTVLESTMFLINKELNKYLDIVEEVAHNKPAFGKRATAFIMNKASQRIIDKYELYYDCIHLETFIKCLGTNNIKNFLYDQAAKRENVRPFIFNSNSLNIFIRNMPKDERLNFIKQLFIDKVHKEDNLLSDSDKRAMTYISDCAEHGPNAFRFLWSHLPFNTCFDYMKEYLQSESRPRDVKKTLSTIITRANENQENLNMLIQYFSQYNKDASPEIRDYFISELTKQTKFHRLDERTWIIVEKLMSDTNKDCNKFSEVILIYKIINGHEVPQSIYKDINYCTLKNFKKQLNEIEKKKIVEFLYNYFSTQLNDTNSITKIEQFEKAVKTLEMCLSMLNDCDENLINYSFLIDTIRNLVDIRNKYRWSKDMSSIYNKNRSWKRYLFPISFDLSPSESVLINYMKHDPEMMEKYQQEISDFKFDEKKNLTRFLKKIKIYWPTSIAEDWKKSYLTSFDKLNRQKASALGVCVLLPRMQLQNLLDEYAPNAPKIDYNNFDELKFNMQKSFAKTLHYARPQPPLQTVLLYAQGDYLQYVLPALLSIFHNLSFDEGNKQILKLIDTQVSLQKHIIRLAFLKLNTKDLAALFTNIWQMNQHPTLRNVLFKSVYDLLCKENDNIKLKQLWNLLESFIDGLNYNENSTIYDLLLQVKPVHITVRPDYFCKSYYFMKKLIESDEKYKTLSDKVEYNLILYVKEIIELLPSQIVSEIVLDIIESDFKKVKEHYYNFCLKIEVISAYLLCATDESTQIQKYNVILQPLITYCSDLFKKKEYFIRNNLDLLLKKLREDMKSFIVDKQMIVPIKMFELIQRDLEDHFDISENYYMITQWKLTVAFTSTLCGNQIDDWDETSEKVSQIFAGLCRSHLKEHCKKYFSRIYILYSNCLNNIIDDIKIQNISWDIYNALVDEKDFIEGYLAAIKLYPEYINDCFEERAKKLRQIIFDNSSAEIKMHYNSKFIKNIS
ncbi:unnamed protein product [Danaus chrysippus]|uniref:(African queen) hypothetical protein n=1 Tax=Danaus chrysippus TaxID=151541 RepID=A0A8J2QBY5_9NEOP|nr:unnamed protein product [Danaus chrysippus]